MRYGGGDSEFIPTERAIVTLWKASASKPNQVVEHDGLSCQLFPFHIPQEQPSFDNKRQVLESIQKHCSIDFLRQQGLNASAAVLLRKTNMNKLLQAWKLWTTKQAKEHNYPPLKTIFNSLLRTKECPMIAGILHESSSSELPCFAQDMVHTASSTPPSNLQIFLFLGAVRDMHPEENDLLLQCCTSRGVPLVHVRLGPVPEFTSKIIAVAVFHHVNGRLGPAMLELQDVGKQNALQTPNQPTVTTVAAAAAAAPSTTLLPPAELHVILTLAMDPSQVVAETKQRTRLLWMLVRVTVSTLWRSRLAGSSSSSSCDNNNNSSKSTSATASAPTPTPSRSPLNNTLTIMFQDKSSITLQQDDLVRSMAEQHKAAPCEYQIIKAINDKLGKELLPIKKRLSSVKQAYSACLDFRRHHHQPATSDQQHRRRPLLDLVECCYKSSQDLATRGKVLVLLGDPDDTTSNNNNNKQVPLTGLLLKTGIEPIPSRLIHPRAVDWEAASVVVTQHLMYQYRLLPAVVALNLENYKATAEEREPKRHRIK